MPRNYLSLTLIDDLTRFLGTESVATKIKYRHGELITCELDMQCLLSGTQVQHLMKISVI